MPRLGLGRDEVAGFGAGVDAERLSVEKVSEAACGNRRWRLRSWHSGDNNNNNNNNGENRG